MARQYFSGQTQTKEGSMGIVTSKEYLDRLKGQKPDVRIMGERVEDVTTSKYFQVSLQEVATLCDWTQDPAKRDEFVFHSDLIDEEVSFWTHFRRTPEDNAAMYRTMKKNNCRNFCSFCMGAGLNVLYMLTWDMDQAKGTDYHRRYVEFLKRTQKEDLRYAITAMDPKGDRSKSPSQQDDPDLFLRVVERRSDGIVVNGAKMHTSSAPISNLLYIVPSREMRQEDADYALSFVTPIDAKGITFITRPGPCPINPDEMANPASSRHSMVECLTVFDNVFVPWENVFMCGEWEFTANFIKYFSSYGRPVKATCISSRMDMIAGASALIAEYNGVANASHIRNKINSMAISSEVGWGCVLGSVFNSKEHPTGLWVPDISLSNAGLYETRQKFADYLGTLMEIAGGVVTTMPTAVDYKNEETRAWIDKYFAGKSGVSTEDRMKLLYFIQELTASRFGGYFLSSAICAVGTPETNRLEVMRNYDIFTHIQNVKEICNISS